MKRTFVAAIASSMLILGTIASANAVEVRVGPGGVYVGHHPHHYYNYGGGCRTVITHRTNRFGEDVTVRRRTCD
jgi:hypothetical protein